MGSHGGVLVVGSMQHVWIQAIGRIWSLGETFEGVGIQVWGSADTVFGVVVQREWVFSLLDISQRKIQIVFKVLI